MSKKIESLSEHQHKKKPRSIEEAERAISRRFRDLTPDDMEEPECLASGDPDKIVDENEEDNDRGS